MDTKVIAILLAAQRVIDAWRDEQCDVSPHDVIVDPLFELAANLDKLREEA